MLFRSNPFLGDIDYASVLLTTLDENLCKRSTHIKASVKQICIEYIEKIKQTNWNVKVIFGVK